MTRAEIAAKHGTPAEFEEAVWRAVGQFISVAEAQEAIERFKRDWEEAGA
jgi:3-methyladenine DNA glycosylase/8-oxoguanine DNA glycosylase